MNNQRLKEGEVSIITYMYHHHRLALSPSGAEILVHGGPECAGDGGRFRAEDLERADGSEGGARGRSGVTYISRPKS